MGRKLGYAESERLAIDATRQELAHYRIDDDVRKTMYLEVQVEDDRYVFELCAPAEEPVRR